MTFFTGQLVYDLQVFVQIFADIYPDFVLQLVLFVVSGGAASLARLLHAATSWNVCPAFGCNFAQATRRAAANVRWAVGGAQVAGATRSGGAAHPISCNVSHSEMLPADWWAK